MEQNNCTTSTNPPVFKDQPILCPWVTACQPYPSTELVKNKLDEFVKERGLTLSNDNTSKNCPSDQTLPQPQCSTGPFFNPTLQPQSSSTHFFHFLRLMQLFPETHPATLHAVLTLSKNKFFMAIDKLLYAQRSRNELLSKKFKPFNGRGRGYASGSRGRQPYTKRYQSISIPKTISNTDLADVQRIVDLAGRNCLEVQSIETSFSSNNDMSIENNNSNQMASRTFVETDNHGIIEIVCFDNDQTVLKQDESVESFEENIENLIDNNDVMNIKSSKLDVEDEPEVIVVGNVEETKGMANDGVFISSKKTSDCI